MANEISSVTATRYKLYIAKLDKENLKKCAYTLMQLLLFPPSQSHLFSLTETSEEISLVLEEWALEHFPPNTLTIANCRWRALSVDLGPSGYSGTGVINKMTLALANDKINVFYLSTATTDFILVEETKLKSAVSSIRISGITIQEEEIEKDSFSLSKLPQQFHDSPKVCI
eukprot:TRINITY_DN3447_c0_g1_i6.p1 TRINITY_DN3447_c0_g1~~TRINITY_DN3447_c0_g1_i6.p1  ORF type:complete len:186 (+),score=24.55 TRINITY_DN3447_c0_g1_i6:48-560(+)